MEQSLADMNVAITDPEASSSVTFLLISVTISISEHISFRGELAGLDQMVIDMFLSMFYDLLHCVSSTNTKSKPERSRSCLAPTIFSGKGVALIDLTYERIKTIIALDPDDE
eukprot:1452018-Ditylum_brightwellii.AAC.1